MNATVIDLALYRARRTLPPDVVDLAALDFELATLRAIRDLRAAGHVASVRNIGFVTRREKRTVLSHIASLKAAGLVHAAAFLDDANRGVRLTGHGKAVFEQAEVYRRDQAGQ